LRRFGAIKITAPSGALNTLSGEHKTITRENPLRGERAPTEVIGRKP